MNCINLVMKKFLPVTELRNLGMIHTKGKNMFHLQAGETGHVMIFYCDIFMAFLPKD